jgi:hypothetical protein
VDDVKVVLVPLPLVAPVGLEAAEVAELLGEAVG